ncbi:signaling protein without kinase domain [Pedobacter sp. BAL39]|nr:signaling protein without kinase domain [Pedobacter sp. BAL39]
MRNELLRSLLVSNFILIVIFYVHSYLIYPLRERRYGTITYVLLLFVCLAVFMLVNHLLMPPPRFSGHGLPHPPPGMRPGGPGWMGPGAFLGAAPFVFVVLVSFTYQLYLDKVKRDKRMEERENIHLKTELEFLSSQISPHFMFNLLNTLVSMARKKSELLEPSLIQLSQLMRYMLYDNNASQISLATEVEYLKNYISLQLLRFGDDIRLNLYLSGSFERYTIAPMLLIPFVENAFKHGTAMIHDPIIDVSLKISESGDMLELLVVNGIAPVTASAKGDSGIGLTNVRRRLDLLYPGKHEFVVGHKNNTFTVKLQIQLQ